MREHSTITDRDYSGRISVLPSRRLVLGQTANVQPDLDRIVKGGEEMVVDAEIESEFTETEENGHGRMTDIFSLGCVFVELLACLLNEKLPMDRKDAKDPKQPPRNTQHLPQEVKMFSQHLPELTNWAQRHIESDKSDTNCRLNPLLGLAIKMISLQPKDRPTVTEVVRDVTRAGSWHFCDGGAGRIMKENKHWNLRLDLRKRVPVWNRPYRRFYKKIKSKKPSPYLEEVL
ncbi:MAG: hypothetical protein Q9192_006908 [Flavoplaca navasiana]